MIVMPSNHGSGLVHYMAGRYPGTLGWLISPGSFKEPRAWLPYAVDNGSFADPDNWQDGLFFDLLDRLQLCRFKPMWVLVPDRLGDRERTLWMWHQYEKKVRRYGWPLAFAVQDGMGPRDVPSSADVVFIGGSTSWKWRNAALFAASFPRIHVGRVNWVTQLEYCEKIGAESCDGTGFFRGGEDSEQGLQLQRFIAGERVNKLQTEMFELV